MEEKKNSKTLLIVVIVILVLAIASVPFVISVISVKSTIDKAKNVSNTINEKKEKIDVSIAKCIYSDLKDASLLTEDEKSVIINVIAEKNNFKNDMAIDPTTIVIKSETNKLYKVEFNTVNKTGSNYHIGYVYKMADNWAFEGFGSDFSKEQLAILKNKICIACGNCNTTCAYEELKDASSLTNDERKELITAVSNNYNFSGNLAVDETTVKIVLETNKLYKVEFNTVNKEGSNYHIGYVWKENGNFGFDGFGSEYSLEQLEVLKTRICTSCGTCLTK